MIWLSNTTAVLYSAEELRQHYSQHTLIPKQFSLTKAYQSNDPLVERFTNPSTEEALFTDSKIDATRVRSEPPTSAVSVKRKRKKPCASPHDSVTDIRREESTKRHAHYAQLLLDAQQLFRQWVEGGSEQISCEDGHCKSDQASSCDLADSQHAPRPAAETVQNTPASEADQSAADVGTFDILALSELRNVVKPKFQYHDSGTEVDLFDNLIVNTDAAERVASAFTTAVLIPCRSRFLISDATRLRPLLEGAPQGGYDCIVMDPPWENKSAKRSGRYPMLPSRHLLSIPIPCLLKQEGGLLALWVTNRERLRRFVDQELLPKWGLEQVATWFWLKVTNTGQLVSPLEVAHRRPYEALVLARPRCNDLSKSQEMQRRAVPDMVFVAVPGEHSRKPHLGRLLARHLPAQPACLEMFARELAAGWTSWGNETLHFQTLDRFMPL